MQVIKNKKQFVSAHDMNFYTAFVTSAEDYSREMFLDPTKCENPSFALPRLTRENFCQRGTFYRTEKIVVQNFSDFFQKYSVDYTKQVLWDVC